MHVNETAACDVRNLAWLSRLIGGLDQILGRRAPGGGRLVIGASPVRVLLGERGVAVARPAAQPPHLCIGAARWRHVNSTMTA